MLELFRFDRSSLKGRASRTEEGYIRGNAVVTRTGVFSYLNADGTVRRELRHPDDVFAKDSLDTLRMIPITNGHPSERLVDANNAERLSIGQTGENVTVDGKEILMPFTITHLSGLQSVEAGRLELSLGYKCQVIDEEGEYNGERYDARQTLIRYNHLATVDEARAGSIARINLDGLEAAQVEDMEVLTQTRKDQSMDKLVSVRVDGLDYQAAPEVARELARLRLKLDESDKTIKDAEEEAENAKKEAEKKQAELDEMKAELDEEKEKKTDEAIKKAAKDRVALQLKAARVTSDSLDDLSDREIMEKVIKTKHDGIDLTGTSDTYVKGRFDAIIESLPKNDAKAITRQVVATAEKLDGDTRSDSQKAHVEAMTVMRGAYKAGVKK